MIAMNPFMPRQICITVKSRFAPGPLTRIVVAIVRLVRRVKLGQVILCARFWISHKFAIVFFTRIIAPMVNSSAMLNLGLGKNLFFHFFFSRNSGENWKFWKRVFFCSGKKYLLPSPGSIKQSLLSGVENLQPRSVHRIKPPLLMPSQSSLFSYRRDASFASKPNSTMCAMNFFGIFFSTSFFTVFLIIRLLTKVLVLILRRLIASSSSSKLIYKMIT